MKRVFAICLFLMSLSFSLFSQNEVRQNNQSTNSVGIGIGLNDFHSKDKYFSPYIYSGLDFSSRIFYRNASDNSRHAADMYFSTGGISSDEQPRDVTLYSWLISYAYTYTVHALDVSGRPLELSLGGGLSTFGALINMPMGYNNGDASWYGAHNFNVHVRSDYRLGERSSLSLQLTTPIVRLVSRPKNGHSLAETNNWDRWDENLPSEVEFFWENLVLFSEIEYRHRLSDHVGLQGTYWFGYASSDRPAELLSINMYMNNFLVGIEWIL